ncbi:MAG: hypothetical protein H8E86_06230 [Planctomycetes bacterium]|nr:hypothetical protein [Planctomycetota bacterium]
MDFLPEQEISDLLREFGIATTQEGDDCAHLEMRPDSADVRDCLCIDGDSCDPEWDCMTVDGDTLVTAAIESVRKIHQGQTVLLPCRKWRSIFDAVAFSMAEDELWQEFDASATIKLNTRDPLLFEAGDEQILASLITALMNDGETQEQSVFLISAGAPILVHLQPGGPVKLWFGNSVLADEVREHYAT